MLVSDTDKEKLAKDSLAPCELLLKQLMQYVLLSACLQKSP